MADAARRETALLAAAVALGAALSFALAISETPQSALGPCLFPLPLVGALMISGQLRWRGGILLIASVAVAYFAALFSGGFTMGQLHVGICIFCTHEEAIANTRNSIAPLQVAGAVASAVASIISFAPLMLLGPSLRDRRALSIMAGATIALALIGAIGLSGALPGMTTTFFAATAPHARVLQNALLLVPWQLAFGVALAGLIRRQTPRAA